MLKFGSLIVVTDLGRLNLSEQNDLRTYFVDGNMVEIDRDTVEPEYKYTKRVAFILGRSINPNVKIDRLISYSRIHTDKLWSHKVVDDETREKVVTPYYGEATEKRYQKLKKLDHWIV